MQRIPDYGNQFLQLDPEQKPSPLGDRFPPHRGKMSNSDKRGSRWRVAPDEGYSGQNAVVLRPHQSPAVTASPDRGKPLFGKLISVLYLLRLLFLRLSEPPPAASVSTIIANRMSTSAHSRSAVAFMSVRKSETYS